MVAILNLGAGVARLALVPELGGAIARLDLGDKPVLRPWSGNVSAGPFALACNILVPFSNRISGGGFSWNGTRYDIMPNLAGEPYPIHGDGFQKAWSVVSHTNETATLVLDNGSIGPFEYCAEQVFSLLSDGLRIELKLTNTGKEALPFGCGFHPWFARDAMTRLEFSAQGVWMEDETHLPTGHLSLAGHPGWDFSASRPLPDHGINNAWTGWAGAALIRQGPAFASLDISASRELNCAIVYSPGKDCGFFCFEPVSHPVDAHNRPGIAGLKVLVPGQSLSVWMQLAWNGL